MPARILVVDDVAANRKLLSARLQRAYYTPLAAESGREALALLAHEAIDLVVLDVVMPDMDGYETCRRIRADPRTRDLPVVLLTSLDQPDDRVRGAKAGADDFLIKPVADFPLFSRLRTLTRLKQASDDLRAKLGMLAPNEPPSTMDEAPAQILIVQDEGDPHGLARRQARRHTSIKASTREAALVAGGEADIALVDLTASGFDPLAVCSSLRSTPATRHLPILAVARESSEPLIAKALEIGADDYVPLPLDRTEMQTRIDTHVRRSRHAKALTAAVKENAALVHFDPLTRLGNRRLFDQRLAEFVGAARRGERPFSAILVDLDHFKAVNDRYGHAVGDSVLRSVARRLLSAVRTNDVACRIGGEEFAVLLDGVDGVLAQATAERLREAVSNGGIGVDDGLPRVTVSIGLAEWRNTETAETVMALADAALYAAKRGGRDRVETVVGEPAILNHS